MKKWLVLAGCMTAMLLIFAARMVVDAWIGRTWGIEQSIRVMPFVDAPIFFLTPLILYVNYRWGPTPKTTSPTEKRFSKYWPILASIYSAAFGLARLVNGLGQMSVIPLLQALDISVGILCVGILPLLAGFVLYQVISLRSSRSNDEQIG